MTKKYRRAVFIVVYRRTKGLFGKEKLKFLLLRRRKHWIGWEFPKGGVDKGEKLIDTAKRELFEECGQIGFNFRKYDFSGRYIYDKELRDRKGFFGQTYALFSAEIKDRKVKIDEKEHSRYKWVSFNRALGLLTHENQIKGLKVFLKKTAILGVI